MGPFFVMYVIVPQENDRKLPPGTNAFSTEIEEALVAGQAASSISVFGGLFPRWIN